MSSPSTTPMPSKSVRYRTLPLLILLLLTFSLSTATVVGATSTLSLLNSALTTNQWLLPLWNKYFPFFELRAVRWISLFIALIDALSVLSVAMLTIVPDKDPGETLRSAGQMSFCTAILEIPAIIFTAKKVSLALNGSTTASWRCGWIALEHEGEVVVEGMLEGMVVESSSSVPRDFGRMCRESRLATYGPLALLVVHMLLVFIVACIATSFPKTPATAAGEDGEESAREEDQSAREHGDAITHDDSEGNKMVELQSRGEFSSSSSTQPPLYGK